MEQNNTPLISVIVPIYNVEKYVRKCLNSLRDQSMKQIEVICIDDGSTDFSGTIADEYCNIDADGKYDTFPLVRVIHTDNRGLSAARNKGIDEARADWVMFVDGDDWVERDFCETPYRTASEYSAEMVIFGFDKIKHDRVMKSKKLDSPVGIIDEITAHEYGTVTVWNKLYKRNLFNTIRYPEGQVYEDYATTHKLVHEAKIIVFQEDYLYHYVIRPGSITHTRSLEHKKDRFTAIKKDLMILLSMGFLMKSNNRY